MKPGFQFIGASKEGLLKPGAFKQTGCFRKLTDQLRSTFTAPPRMLHI
jgi:hypothetical protein